MRSSTSTTPTRAASSRRASSSSCSGESLLAGDARANPNPNTNPTAIHRGSRAYGNPPPDSDLLSRQVSPGVEVTEADEAYVLEMVDRCADTHLPVRATHACLLRAVRSEGLGQLAPGALRTTSIRASYAYQPPACRTYRVPWHHRSTKATRAPSSAPRLSRRARPGRTSSHWATHRASRTPACAPARSSSSSVAPSRICAMLE